VTVYRSRAARLNRRYGLADLPALMLPAMLFNALVIVAAWRAWWI